MNVVAVFPDDDEVPPEDEAEPDDDAEPAAPDKLVRSFNRFVTSVSSWPGPPVSCDPDSG